MNPRLDPASTAAIANRRPAARIHRPNARLVKTSAPRFELRKNVVATPFVLDGLGFRGALYDESGVLIARSQRVSGPTEKIYPEDPARCDITGEIEFVRGRGYYFGNIMSHYGHFITEGLSALWRIDEKDYDYFVAHPFIWQRGTPEFMVQAFRKIGLDPDKIRLVQGPTRFEELIIPDRLWLMNSSVNQKYIEVVRKLKAGFVRRQPRLKLYLSRSQVIRRAVPNERRIEEVFRSAGFVIIQPQNFGFLAQLELYGQAAVIAGLAGSALHNVIFCPRGATTISIGDRRTSLTRNQPVCGALIEGMTAVIPYAEDPDGFDITALKTELTAILRELPALNSAAAILSADPRGLAPGSL